MSSSHRPATDHGAARPVDVVSRDAASTSWSAQHASLVAGAGLLLMAAFAMVGNFVAVEGLVTPGDPAGTAADILASEGLFRVGVASLFAVAVLDVIVAWALYRVFVSVHAGWSLLAAVVRLVYAAVFLVAVSHLLGAVDLLASGDRLGSLATADLAMLRIEAFHATWRLGLGLFGIHLVVLGVLAARSGYVNRALAWLLLLAGAGYLFDGLAGTLIGEAAPSVSLYTFVGEVWLAVWLLLRARRVAAADAQGQPMAVAASNSASSV